MNTADRLRRDLDEAPGPDDDARLVTATRAESVLRPLGALARLDEIAVFLAGWQRTTHPRIERPAALIFASDHGVTAEGVSAYPSEVTGAMVQAFERQVATVNILAREAAATVRVIDVGVGDPTGNLAVEDAMSEERFARSVAMGRAAVAETDSDLIALGEMGIGNTTPAAAVSGAVFGGDPAAWVGRGTGVDDEALDRKTAVVRRGIERISDSSDPLEVLRRIGGAELAAIAGAIVEARRRSIPVVLDGYVVTAAAAPLGVAVPGSLSHCIAAHRSAEPGHDMLLHHLGLRPLLDLEMRLGEASGAVAVIPLIRMAAAVVVDVPTFEEFGLPAGE